MSLRLTATDTQTGDTAAGLFTSDAIAGLLHVSPQRIKAWRVAGLIQPTTTLNGVDHYDFVQLAAARSLCDLVRSGIKPGQLRDALAAIRGRAASEKPLTNLLARDGRILRRGADHELEEADGQLQLSFDGAEVERPLKLRQEPSRSAVEWFIHGAALEADDDLGGAVHAYQQALQIGGPDAEVCFALAYVVAETGNEVSAIERYRQAVEINPDYGDAWNNLGVLLSNSGDREHACAAFREAIRVDPHDSRAHYNLADCLDELGRNWEAVPHWQSFLRSDSTSPWAAYARTRVS